MTKSIKGTQTEQNLLKAFAGESQARNRYEFFASVARKRRLRTNSQHFHGNLYCRKRNMPNVSSNSWKGEEWK